MGPVPETFDSPLSRKRRFIRNLAMISTCVLIVGILAWKVCYVQSPAAAPSLAKTWHEQVYGLDDDETSRLIPPPYSAQRMQIMTRGYYQHPMPGVMGQLAFYTGQGRGP